jgi:ATP-dependent Clp protease ATP-binding subunit ClpA
MTFSGRYSQHARRAMMQARQCAQYERHSMVDTSHLLVGIMRAEGCLGQRVLLELGMDCQDIERRIVMLHRPQARADTTAPPMSRALRTTLAFAVEESGSLGHHYIGTEHLLLGLARGGGGAAEQLLHSASVSLDQIRRQIRRVLQKGETEIGLERALRMARLSELSRRVLSRAALIAEDMHQPTVDLMHLILALTQETRSPAGRLLKQCGLDEARMISDTAWPRRANDNLLEEVLDEAVLLAERMGSHYTGTDHIILVLAVNRHGMRLLVQYGVDIPLLTTAIDQLI